MVQQQRTKILEFFEKKEKQVELQRKIQRSNMQNTGRLKCLKAREDHLRSVLDEATANLSKISGDSQRYPSILKGLMMQGLFQLLEPQVTLRCRRKDEDLVNNLLPECLHELQQVWGERSNVCFVVDKLNSSMNLQVVVDREHYLPDESAGGVEMYAKGGKIKVTSTLESRLELIAGQIIPQIRTALFGPNPNRKFFD